MNDSTRYLVKHHFIFGGKNLVGARFTHVIELALALRTLYFWRESLCYHTG